MASAESNINTGMRNSPRGLSSDPRSDYARFMNEQIQPNIAITATLYQTRSYDSPTGLIWRRGKPLLYEGVFAGLMKRLNRAVFGRSAARHGKRIFAGGAIEGDGLNEHYHAHLYMRCPEHLSTIEFDTVLRRVMLQSPWLKPNLKVEEIYGDWVGYVHKRNPENYMIL